MKKNIILSFDYELFFGEDSGTILKSIIIPTNLLLDTLENNGLRGNFFVDCCMFWALEGLEDDIARDDLAHLKDQLRDIIRRGHRIELHLHPHWIDAQYLGDGRWDFSNFLHYSLSSFSEEEVTNYIVNGANYLNEIAREVQKDYAICAFRAGGWAIQPFANLKRGFKLAHIRIDSSVASGAYGKNQYSFFDFTNAPKLSHWHFCNDVCKPDNNAPFLEVPITSFHRGFFYRVIDGIHRKVSTDLFPISDGTHRRKDLIEAHHPSRSKNVAMMTFSKLSPFSVLISFLLCKSNTITFIDHPKDLSLSLVTSMSWISKYSNCIMYKDL